ncbi:ribonuclease Z [Oscillibacter sp. MSJ-2]|uniref:Ribonuclease Z n=1 Tax=Dysosmobacter acutus TaxID=2841504 RepID=A0ABS6F5Y7_9FIRM|nr:ribonuclease Z [Dysosmobacter acutus]MBU5625671.1 ribonuclease Z [Dysosmobacter acutus]
MILIACVDDNNGMLFHARRQSRDRMLRARILRRCAGRRLWMNAYSQGQFPAGAEITVHEDCLSLAGEGEFCFVEDQDVRPVADRVEQVILYRWNRVYPADVFFSLSLDGWNLTCREEFAGSSHQRITEEVYVR